MSPHGSRMYLYVIPGSQAVIIGHFNPKGPGGILSRNTEDPSRTGPYGSRTNQMQTIGLKSSWMFSCWLLSLFVFLVFVKENLERKEPKERQGERADWDPQERMVRPVWCWSLSLRFTPPYITYICNIYIKVYMCICMYVCVYMYLCMYICACMYIYKYVCICVCVYIYIYIYI